MDDIVFGCWVVNGDNVDYFGCGGGMNNCDWFNVFFKLDYDGIVIMMIYINNVDGNGL